ncbi:class I SAM-dependent methyltransferase [Streptomyces sp. NPDC088197]|uniref:class I SAM-dependent methyltransferase n=1 Tax=Streptomyces sp. NPDC088197 TaxID=3365840 RepID=UPI0037F8453E
MSERHERSTAGRAVPEADGAAAEPDSTAVRVALWRAVHVLHDPPPHVLADEIGLRLADPEAGWRERGDMHPEGTSRFRAGVVARARFVEDLVVERLDEGVGQYVLLGAGLDTFAQRRPDLADRLRIFEVDRPEPQEWKRRRLTELGYGVGDGLRLVPVDFETAGSWWDHLRTAGFDAGRPAVVASAGVSMYLTKEANAATLRTLTSLAPGSTVAMTFMPPLDLMEPDERAVRQAAENGARGSGTPFISFYAPAEILALARAAGFTDAHHVSAAALNERYFAGRPDGLRTSSGEELLVATV